MNDRKEEKEIHNRRNEGRRKGIKKGRKREKKRGKRGKEEYKKGVGGLTTWVD